MFNEGSGEQEFKLLEAAKLLMFRTAVNLYEDMISDKNLPVFTFLLFARDTSENLESFLKNHLNKVGDSGGLEQVSATGWGPLGLPVFFVCVFVAVIIFSPSFQLSLLLNISCKYKTLFYYSFLPFFYLFSFFLRFFFFVFFFQCLTYFSRCLYLFGFLSATLSFGCGH